MTFTQEFQPGKPPKGSKSSKNETKSSPGAFTGDSKPVQKPTVQKPSKGGGKKK